MYSFSLYDAKEELFCCNKWKIPKGLLFWKQEHYPKDIAGRMLCVLGIFCFRRQNCEESAVFVINKKEKELVDVAKRNYDLLSEQLIKLVGGKENVTYFTHCITRLRFNLKDVSLVEKEEIEATDGVIGCRWLNNQLQIIIGTDVDSVYQVMCKKIELPEQKKIDEKMDDTSVWEEKKKMTIQSAGKSIMDYVSAVMTGILPMLVAAAMCKTIGVILGPSVMNVIAEDSELYMLFDMLNDAFFYFLPIYLGCLAAKKLNIDMIYGMYIGGLIIVPDFVALVGTQDTFHVFEIPVPVADYSQSFIPVILGVWIMSYIVKFLKKYVPKAVSALVVPTVTVLLMTVIMFAVCAPIGSYIGKIIGNVFIWLYESNQIVRVIAFIGMAVIQPYLVISGMHMVLINFAIMNYMEVGYDAFVMVVGCGCSFALYGIAFGAFLRFKKKENKAMALGNVASGVLAGVTEPILYGILLRYKKAPLALGIVCVIVGVFCGIFTPKQYVIGGFNNVFATAAAFTGGSVMNIVLGIVMCAAAFVLGTIASCLIVDYKED